MKWIWTTHIERQLIERKIPKELVENAITHPDETVQGKEGRVIYHKMLTDKLLRVVTESDKIITAYFTNKIKKYWKG